VNFILAHIGQVQPLVYMKLKTNCILIIKNDISNCTWNCGPFLYRKRKLY